MDVQCMISSISRTYHRLIETMNQCQLFNQSRCQLLPHWWFNKQKHWQHWQEDQFLVVTIYFLRTVFDTMISLNQNVGGSCFILHSLRLRHCTENEVLVIVCFWCLQRFVTSVSPIALQSLIKCLFGLKIVEIIWSTSGVSHSEC